MPETTRNGVTLHYEVEGCGQPVLLIHGHTLDLTIWNDLTVPLIAAGCQVIRFDLRGHGRSDRPEKDYRISDHAMDALSILDHANVDRAAVIGYSIGGGIALVMALTDPLRVDRLGLMSPVMPDRPFEEAFFDNLREVARVARTDGITAAMIGPWMASPLWAASLSKPGVAQRLESIVGNFPGAEYLASQRDQPDRDWNVPDRLGEISKPTLVMVGELEMPGFLAWASEISEKIPNATLEIFGEMSHLHLLEDPRSVADSLLEFVQPAQ